LGRLNGSTADDALLLALRDPDERVRRAAAFALAPSGHPLALAAVVDGLHSDDPVLRDATGLALSDLDPDQMARIQLLLQAQAGSPMDRPPA
jgi:HEAT repeat protein